MKASAAASLVSLTSMANLSAGLILILFLCLLYLLSVVFLFSWYAAVAAVAAVLVVIILLGYNCKHVGRLLLSTMAVGNYVGVCLTRIYSILLHNNFDRILSYTCNSLFMFICLSVVRLPSQSC